jgi:hypothetical protein
MAAAKRQRARRGSVVEAQKLRHTARSLSARDYLVAYLRKHPREGLEGSGEGAIRFGIEEAARALGWTPPGGE